MTQDWLDLFLEKLPPELRMGRALQDPNAPQAIFRGALKLTRPQEQRLVEHCLTRIRQLETDLGRTATASHEWWRGITGIAGENLDHATYRSFFGRRALADMIYAGELDWRIAAWGGVYRHSNQHIPLTRRLTQQMIARAQNFFFGTSPIFGITPVGKADAPTAAAVEKFCRLGFDRAQAVQVGHQALELALPRGECVIKPRWDDRRSYYEDYLTVVLDADGEPYLAADGEYVFPETDTWPEVEIDGVKRFVLGRDGQTPLPAYAAEPDEVVTDTRLVEREAVDFQGLDLGIMRYQDFLCPLTAASVDDADIVVHMADRPKMEILHEAIEHLRRTGSQTELPGVIEMLRRTASDAESPVSHEFSRRPELGEGGGLGGQDGYARPYDAAVARTAECWVTYPAKDDGVLRKLVVLIDLDNEEPISYDYQHRMVPPRCGRPFHVVRVNPVVDRWHGQGTVEVFWPLNHIIDLHVNRINYANQQAGSFRVWNPSRLAEFEGVRNPVNLTVNGGELYTWKGNSPINISEVYSEVPLVNINQRQLMEMIQFGQQMLTNMSGVASTNDNNAAGLDTSQLATGILHLERMGQELFAPLITQAGAGFGSMLRHGVLLSLEHRDTNEDLARYFSDDPESLELIRAVNPKDFHFDLQLLLSRYRSYQQSIQIGEAIGIVERYGSTLPEMRPALRPLVLKLLEIYEMHGADSALALIDTMPVPVMPPGPPPQTGNQHATQGPGAMAQPPQ